MNILDTIVEKKRVEVLLRRQKKALSELSASPFYRRETNRIDLERLKEKPGIIAEFKRRSPSRGSINMDSDPLEVAGAYGNAGAAAMSILTDRTFFGGSLADLRTVREAYAHLVLLRKDFIIDPYQVHEASAYGADMVLLIASILEKSEVSDLAMEAGSLGLQVLFEIHSEDELEKYHDSIGFVGVNNRDLKTFTVDTATSIQLIGSLPGGIVPVSESGIGSTEEIRNLWNAGYKLFLLGETFMREQDPGLACRTLMEQI